MVWCISLVLATLACYHSVASVLRPHRPLVAVRSVVVRAQKQTQKATK